MNHKLRTLLGIALPVLTIGVFFVLLAFSLIRLHDIKREMGIEASPNMLWVLSRAHAASLRLGYTVNRFVIHDSSASELERNYNVFLSRLRLLDHDPQLKRIKALGFADELSEFQQHLPELNSLMAKLQPHDVQAARAINALLTPYNRMLGRAANKAMIAQWNRLGSMLEATGNQLEQIIISLIGILVAGAVLTLHFLLAARQTRQRTRQLKQEKALSQLLIRSSGEGIVAVDHSHQCTLWNSAAQTLFSQPADATIGRHPGEVSAFFRATQVEQAIDGALKGRASTLDDLPAYTGIHEGTRTDPDTPDETALRYLDLRCFPLRDGAHIIGGILLILDVTERRAEQREIAMHRDHLEQLVQDRTQELNAALEREHATAELYRHFGAMISHQFRTPLSIVDSAMQRLIRRGERLSTTEIQQRSTKARDAIARLVKLIESTLDAERLDSGQIESRLQPCDLGQLAAGVCQRQREAAEGRSIKLTLPDTQLPMARCDPAHAEHILTNLLSNALKYSPAATPITVDVRCAEHAIECAITNEAALDCETARTTLFERYSRGNNAQGRPGIGLGLYMARALARLQGGDVQLAGGEQGTVTFTTSLPHASDSPATRHSGQRATV